MDLAFEFLRIFTGNSRGHGEFQINDQKGVKAKGKATTVPTAVNEDLWREHIAGVKGIGIVPITENNTSTWGAVDIDEYEGLDLEELSNKLPEPLILCRSKSGGAHVFLFTSQPVSSKVLRKKLMLVARALGHPNAEIFPKQDKLGPNDIGNWINMPYFKAESTNRYAIKNGLKLTGEEFVSLIADNAINIQQLVAFNIDSLVDDATSMEFADAPPCLRELIGKGFPPGSRNSALFSMGVFARMKYESGWEDKVFDYNQRFMGPGSYSEVAGIIRSLNKKSYLYKCKDQPLLSVCDKEACACSKFGVQLNTTDEKNKRPNILDEVDRPIKCYAPTTNSKDDPYWVFSINGTDIDVTIDMIKSQAIFAREYLRQYHRLILPIKDSKWVSTINELLAEAEIHQLAPDAGPEGQMWIHLEEFCTNKSQARHKDELTLGKPWHEDGRTYFRSGDFMKYLDQQRFRSLKEHDIFMILKRNGAKHHTFNLKGKFTRCWSITSFDKQTDGFDREVMPNDSEY